MKNIEDIEQGKTFPLTYAYKFLSENGYEDKVSEIRSSKDIYKTYTSTLRRAKIVKFLDNLKLIDKFIDQYWSFGFTPMGINKLNRLRRLYDSFVNDATDEEEDEEESIEGSSFAYEEELKNYLAKNLSTIESGLKLYIDDDDKEGIEYSVGTKNKRIDILGLDKKSVPVNIELKVSKGYERVIGQTPYYKSRIKKIFNTNKVRMIIVAREISEQLKLATEEINDIKLFEYSLSIKLEKVK